MSDRAYQLWRARCDARMQELQIAQKWPVRVFCREVFWAACQRDLDQMVNCLVAGDFAGAQRFNLGRPHVE